MEVSPVEIPASPTEVQVPVSVKVEDLMLAAADEDKMPAADVTETEVPAPADDEVPAAGPDPGEVTAEAEDPTAPVEVEVPAISAEVEIPLVSAEVPAAADETTKVKKLPAKVPTEVNAPDETRYLLLLMRTRHLLTPRLLILLLSMRYLCLLRFHLERFLLLPQRYRSIPLLRRISWFMLEPPSTRSLLLRTRCLLQLRSRCVPLPLRSRFLPNLLRWRIPPYLLRSMCQPHLLRSRSLQGQTTCSLLK